MCLMSMCMCLCIHVYGSIRDENDSAVSMCLYRNATSKIGAQAELKVWIFSLSLVHACVHSHTHSRSFYPSLSFFSPPLFSYDNDTHYQSINFLLKRQTNYYKQLQLLYKVLFNNNYHVQSDSKLINVSPTS